MSISLATSTAAQVREAEPRESTSLRLGDAGECVVDQMAPAFVGGAESSAALTLLAGALAKAGVSAAVDFARVFVQRWVDSNSPPAVVVSTGALSAQLDPDPDGDGMLASSPLRCISISHGVRKTTPDARSADVIERIVSVDPFKHFHEGDDPATFDGADLDRLGLLEPPEVYAEIWLDWHEATAFRPLLGAVYFRTGLAPVNPRRPVDIAITVTLSAPGGEDETAFAFALTDLEEGRFYPAGYFTTSSPWIANPAPPTEEEMMREGADSARTGLLNVQVSLQQSQEPGLVLSYANQMLTLLDTTAVESAAETAIKNLIESQ